MSKSASESTPFQGAGFFCLRSPLLPVEDLALWSAGAETDCNALEARLRKLTAQPLVREALFLATPSLEEALSAYDSSDDAAFEGKPAIKVRRSLVKYLYRMTTRCTPYGLFAGVSMGRMDSQTSLVLPPRDAYKRHTRLDMHFLGALALALVRDPELREELRFEPNSSAYLCGDDLRYAEARIDKEARQYHLVSAERTDYLETTLERARGGSTVGALAADLVNSEPEVELEEAHAYVGELVDSQLLLPNLEPSAVGDEPTAEMVAVLRKTRSGETAAAILDTVSRAIASLDGERLGQSPARYRELAATLTQLPAAPQIGKLFQVDLVKPAPQLRLGADVIAEMSRAVTLLGRISPQAENPDLKAFRERFVERYESRSVPLAVALDADNGIPFGNAGLSVGVLEGFPRTSANKGDRPTWTPRDAKLFRCLARTRFDPTLEVSLTDADIESLEASDPRPLPDVLTLIARLAAESSEAIARGAYRIVVEGVARGAGKLLGRFCHADQELRSHLVGLLRAEEALHPERVFAEIVHLPEGRLGNVVLRPRLRPYEIEYLGRSSVDADHRLSITDLWVCVRGERVVLHSRRLGREVIPSLSSAINTSLSGLPLYRFLASLEGQGTQENPTWSWGALDSLPALPRVTSGRLVLSRAQWRLDEQQLRALDRDNLPHQLEAVHTLRSQLRCPRRIVLADSDNELLVDLDNVLSVEAFGQLVKGRQSCVVLEHLPDLEELCVTGPEGRFTHQLFVPFIRKQVQPAVQSSALNPPDAALDRSFAPGSSWLYFKLYTGHATAERILARQLPALIEALRATGVARWFFIRYGDPNWHIRLRFEGAPQLLATTVLPEFHAWAAPLLANGLVHKVQTDTYEREVERYGGDSGIVLSEALFHHDSEAVLAILSALPREREVDARWRLALWGAHALLVDLGFTLAERRDLVALARENFAAELPRSPKDDALHETWFSAKFRAERGVLAPLLDHTAPPQDFAAASAFSARSRALAPTVQQLRDLARRGALTVPLDQLARSYVHMHVNRMLQAASREEELVIYDLLARLYRSELARKGPGPA